MSLRELLIGYILFGFSTEELLKKFQVTEEELLDISDIDLLEIYNHTIISPIGD